MQSGGARPDFLDTVGAEEKEASPPPWRHDWRIGAGATRQLGGRWALQQEQAQTDTNALNGALVTVGTTTVATQAPEITIALGELAKQLLSGFAIKTTAAGAAAAATGAVLMLVPRQAGGDVTHYEVSEELRIAHRSDEIYGQYQRKIGGEWQDTGVQVASIHDAENNVTGFSGLSEEEAASLQSPNSFPVTDRMDPSSSYPATEPIDTSPGGYQPYDGDRGQVLDNPMPDPGERITPNTEYPADSGWQSPQVMMSEEAESNAPKGLPNPLKNKMKRIRNQTAAGGNRGISGSVSNDDALRLGQEFVGPGYKVMSNGKGYVSADGLRTFRFPANKRGVNPATGEPWSNTGRQVNFETKAARDEASISNVHLDVQ
jgi:hypothetical protein